MNCSDILAVNRTGNWSNLTNCDDAIIPHKGCLDASRVVHIITHAIIIQLVIACNAFILVRLKPFEAQRRTNIEVLILYLSVFDMMSSVMLIVDVYENVTCFKKWPLGLFGCKIIYPLYSISLNMSVCILIIMSVDRCRSIVTPLKKKFSQMSIHIAVMLSFFVVVILQWHQFQAQVLIGQRCNLLRSKKTFSVTRVVITIVRDNTFIFVFTVTSVLIYRSLKSNVLFLGSGERKKKETHRVVAMLILMELVFTVLVVPYDVYDCAMYISRMWGGPGIKFTRTIQHVDRILSALQMSNSFANCFIYAKMHQYLRVRSTSTSTINISEYNNGRRETKQEVMWTNPAYNPDGEFTLQN